MEELDETKMSCKKHKDDRQYKRNISAILNNKYYLILL